MRRTTRSFTVLCLLILMPAAALAAPETVTILHTNDLHSHLMPFSPELDFIPDQTSVDDTRGGWARIATVFKNIRASRANPVFTVDGGDFTMGTLFHMLAREKSFELRLMHEMGYDFTTLGNHEFDMFPDGLARIITTAEEKGQLPGIVFSNAIFSGESDADDALEAVFDQGIVRPYAVRETPGGLTIGFFGLMGKIAAEQAPFASPVTFRDPVEAARDMVNILRKHENVDIVICLSHSGLYDDADTGDEEIASRVQGIDVIISGHSHTVLKAPLIVNDTIIVQTGKYGRGVGVLDLAVDGDRIWPEGYERIPIDDKIPADPGVQAKINGYITEINENLLDEHGLSYWKIIGKTGFDLTLREAESTVGNLLTDAIRWYVHKHDQDREAPQARVQMAIKANGVIRADILKGETGRLAVADVFRTLPLGIGMGGEKSPGYPLVSCYIHAYEIKRALEVITTVYPLKGEDYFIQLSGVRFTYNPYRVPFDRVTGIEIQTEEGVYEPLDYSRSNEALYRVVANIYEATFLQVIGDFTYNLLTIVPKDRSGNPIDALVDYRIDADPEKPGIQELKEWIALMDYISHFEDRNDDGLADIPGRYRRPEGRIVEKPSINPVNLLYRGTMVTWAAFAMLVLAAGIVIFILRLVIKRIRR